MCSTNDAETGQLDGSLIEHVAITLAEMFGRFRDPLVLGLDDGATRAADQELPSMGVIGVFAGDEGPRGVQPMHQTNLDQEIQTTIDARRRDGGAVRPNQINEVIGGDGPSRRQQLAQHRAALRRESPTTRAA